KLLQRHLLFSTLFTLLLITLFIIFFHVDLFRLVDFSLYDRYFQWRGPLPTSDRISLVFMDNESAKALKREQGKWSRVQMAKALRNLCGAGAEVVGLDLVFFSPSPDKQDDTLLAEAMDACGNVVLAKYLPLSGRGEITPLPEFAQSMIGDGFINMFPDKDGKIRKIPFLSTQPAEGGLSISPSFSLELVRVFLNIDYTFDFPEGPHFILGSGGGRQLKLPYPELRIHYYGTEKVFDRLSFKDVVQNTFNPKRIKGKIVLIGGTLATDGDFFPTPFSGYDQDKEEYRKKFGQLLSGGFGKQMPGVACHAQAVETILNGDFIYVLPNLHIMGIIFFLGVFGLLFYFARPGPFWGLLILSSVIIGVVGISHLFFIKRLWWIQVAPAIGLLMTQYISGIAFQWLYGRSRNRMVTSLFGKYVSRSVVDAILKGEISAELKGRSQEVTVLFSDLRGFTSLSEGLNPQETGVLLNAYFDAMIPLVFDQRGTLDKLMGDAVMAFFGAPENIPDHPIRAAETALNMVSRLAVLKQESSIKGINNLAVGIGLNTGLVTVGNLGSQRFVDYTVIGDAVNLGSRLEGLNKTYGTTTIVSQDTRERLDNRFILRELDVVRVKGKDDAITIFELFGFSKDIDENAGLMLKVFEQEEITIDLIAGTSAGALIGGAYAAGTSPQEI
ncbi:MAG: CHASE2 domain-containing protein, partial [Candidatus Aminicenantes bacterium]|nr:CHASE2 domain-containing protein [Candidatus Aminicenantes bacterium]